MKYEEAGKTILDYDYTQFQLTPLNLNAILTPQPFAEHDDLFDERYVFHFSQFTRIPATDLMYGNGLTHTWLRGPGSDAFLDIDIYKYPNG